MTVEDMTNNVNDILLNSAKQALQQKKHMKMSAKKKKKWFDRDCFSLRKEVIKFSRQLCRANATHETRILFFSKEKANSVNGTNPNSPEDWLKHFSKLLFDD